MEEAKSLMYEINRVRMNPQGCILDIREQLSQFDGPKVLKTSKGERLKVAEGKYVWTDAIIFLEQCQPREPLVWCPQLSIVASEFERNFNEGHDVSAFKLLKDRYIYNGNISFNVSQSEAEQSLREIVISMIIDDGDERRGNRNTVFDSKYTHFGGYVTKRGRVTIAPLFFSDISQFKVKIPGQKDYSENSIKYSTSLPQVPSAYQMLDRGKSLIYELNSIRRDPKKLIPILKADLAKFKEDKTLSKNGFCFSTKEGKVPFLDLITQLEETAPLPLLHCSDGLSITTAEQVNQLEQKIQVYSLKTNHNIYLKKYTTTSQNTNNFIMNRNQGDSMIDLLIFALTDDGDLKRSVRRKLLSPVLKVAGAAVGNKYFAVDICESAKDNRGEIENYFQRINRVGEINRLGSTFNSDNKIQEVKSDKRVTFGVQDSSQTFSSSLGRSPQNILPNTFGSSYIPPSKSYSSSSCYSVNSSKVESSSSNPYTYGSTVEGEQKQSPRFRQSDKTPPQKNICKKTTKSSTSNRNGKTYKKIVSKIEYDDGTISETQEEEVVN